MDFLSYMNLENLTDAQIAQDLRDCIDALSNYDLMLLDTMQSGIAYFPKIRKAVADPLFANWDTVPGDVKAWFEDTRGPYEVIIDFPAFMSIDEETCCEYEEDPEQLGDPAFLALHAPVIRQALHDSVDMAVGSVDCMIQEFLYGDA